MKSIKEIYKIGRGPSSSHTIGPQRICEYVLECFGRGNYKVVLFGSLALTGKGHGTDRVIKEVLGEQTEIVFDANAEDMLHPNTLDIYQDGVKIIRAESVGGGDVVINGKVVSQSANLYPQKNFAEIKTFCEQHKFRLSDYVRYYEPDIDGYMAKIWQIMKDSVERGLSKEGEINGGLGLQRKAKALYAQNTKLETGFMNGNRKLSSYSFAVAEENADNGLIVTAPTCGSCGIVPACLYYMYKDNQVSEKEIINALLTAGVIGNVTKENASISGAECGCQAEVGVACSMAAASVADVYHFDLDKIECAAEIALEHHLGLTCDPILGLVQIPCIERNATASIKAINAVVLADSLADKCKISLDNIIQVMYETGKDMASSYRETAKGGLAKLYHDLTKKSSGNAGMS